MDLGGLEKGEGTEALSRCVWGQSPPKNVLDSKEQKSPRPRCWGYASIL